MNSIGIQQAEQDKRVSLIATVVFHALLLLLFLFIGLKQPNPLPKEEAIELSFEDAGGPSGGNSAPEQAAAATPPPVEEVEPETPEPAVTQEEESPVALPKADKPKPKPKPQPKPPPERKPDTRSLFAPSNSKNESSSTFTPGGGSGTSEGTGGGTGGGTGSFSGKGFQGKLSGRGLMRGPSITEKPNEGGRVSLDIFVDRTGRVTHVNLNLDRSTTTSQVLYNLARKAALQCTFSAKPDGPAEQKGEMTFIFELQ